MPPTWPAGLEIEHAGRRPVGLHPVDVDEADQVVEPPMARRHGRFPGRALIQLAVRHEVVDEGPRRLALEAEPDADGDAETDAERAAADLHARRVAGHARHRQATVVGAVGLELRFRDDARLDQSRVQGDRVMTDGQQEAVAVLPIGLLGPIIERVEVGHCQHVGDAERLRDVALSLNLAHAQRVAADAPGAIVQARRIGQRLGEPLHG